MEAKQKIGEILKAQREFKNLSYFQIQKATWIINTQVKNMENGTSNYTIDSLLKLLDLLDLQLKIEEKTDDVIFLRDTQPDESSIFAYFPNLKHSPNFNTSYAHIGQHSGCSHEYAKECKPATPEEYKDLKNELETIGYKLNIINSI